MRIRAINPDLSKAPKTFLATATAASAATATVRNTSTFANNDYAQFGEPGEERTEIIKVTSVTAPNTFTTMGAAKFPHGVDTAIYKLVYNQVKFYRSIDGGVTYPLLTTIDIQPDQRETVYDDINAASTYYYKVSYYNQTSGIESTKSQPLIATGYTTFSLKKLEDRVLVLYPDREARFLQRGDLKDWINERYLMVQTDVNQLNKGYFSKSNNASPLSLVSGTYSYALPSDFVSLVKVEVSYDGTTYNRAFPMDERYSNPGMVYSKDQPIYDFLDANIIFKPTPDSSSGKYKLWYYYWAELSELTDEINASVRPFKDVLVLHALAMACYSGGKEDRGDRFMKRADELQSRLINRMKLRQQDETEKVVMSDTSFLELEEFTIPA
jgi:hypothetical protein